jgi:hypothetical protein
MLVSGPGVNTPKAPVNVSPYPGWKNPPLPGSNWVSPDANHGDAEGDYIYEFTFCLCREGKHILNLSFYADNEATVNLNGTQIGHTTGSSNFYGASNSVNYSWASGPGINKLRIVVRNNELSTGLDAVLKIAGASVGGCCQERSPRPDWRSEIIERMSAEAANLNLRVQGNYTFQSVGNAVMVVVPVLAGDRKIRSTLINGRAKLAYLEGQESIGLPNGLYLIQGPPGLAKLMAAKFGDNSGVFVDQKVTFVSTDGRTTKDVPVVAIYYHDAIPTLRHYWTRIELCSAFVPAGCGLWVDAEPE